MATNRSGEIMPTKSATCSMYLFFFQAEDGIRDLTVTGVQTCALPIFIRGYFDACNTGDANAVATFFAPGAVHYFPPDMYEGPFRGGDTIGAKWSWAVKTLGSRWTVDEIICDPESDRAVIEWTHEKTKV